MGPKHEKLTKKHHYLPRHYLKGFVDNEGKFFVFDKNSGNIFQASPSATFFNNGLNTVEFPDGQQSDFLEHLYAQVEHQSWKSFDHIRSSSVLNPIESLDKMNLFFFLLFLYWRLPSNSSLVEKLSKQFFSDGTLDYAKLLTENGGEVPREFIEKFTNLPTFKKSSRMLLPFAPFFKDQNWSKKLESWRFLHSGDNKNWYIVGDNPFITQGENDLDPVNCLKEFIFPVSGNILLIGGYGSVDQACSPEFTVKFGTAILEKAHRFVACQNRSFLEALVKLHNLVVKNGETQTITQNLFEILDTNRWNKP